MGKNNIDLIYFTKALVIQEMYHVSLQIYKMLNLST